MRKGGDGDDDGGGLNRNKNQIKGEGGIGGPIH